MAISLESYAVAIPVAFTVFAILACLARGIWVYHLFDKRQLYLKDFDKFSDQTNIFCAETAAVHQHLAQNMGFEASIKASCLQLLNMATEYENGIRIALSAWEDMIHPLGKDSDTESVNKEGLEGSRMPGKRHRRQLIAVMRQRCIEGIENRKLLSSQMQGMLTITSRQAVCFDEALTPMEAGDFGHVQETMSGGLPITTYDAKLQENASAAGVAYHIPKLEFEDEGEFAQEVQPMPRVEHIPGRNIIAEKLLCFSLPSPTKTSFNRKSSLSVPPRQSSPARAARPPTPGDTGQLDRSGGRTD